jgi:hypothetical protein
MSDAPHGVKPEDWVQSILENLAWLRRNAPALLDTQISLTDPVMRIFTDMDDRLGELRDMIQEGRI